MCSVKADTAAVLSYLVSIKVNLKVMTDWKGIKTHLKDQTPSDWRLHGGLVQVEVFFMHLVSKPHQESHRRSDQDCPDWWVSPPALWRCCVEFDRYPRRSGDYCVCEKAKIFGLKFSDIHFKSVNFSLGLLSSPRFISLYPANKQAWISHWMEDNTALKHPEDEKKL